MGWDKKSDLEKMAWVLIPILLFYYFAGIIGGTIYGRNWKEKFACWVQVIMWIGIIIHYIFFYENPHPTDPELQWIYDI